jgi:hypothetical protein
MVKQGDIITVKNPTVAYYSGYGGLPGCSLESGETAKVINPKVPAVFGHRHYFCLVEFDKLGRTWRAALWPGDYK